MKKRKKNKVEALPKALVGQGRKFDFYSNCNWKTMKNVSRKMA